MTLLTKSKYLAGLKCNRYLWFMDRKQLPDISLSNKHKFAQGHDFEKFVYQLYADAENLAGLEFQENLEKTKFALEQKKVIFEAGFQVETYFVRVDVLEPNGNGWDIYEIKSSTEVKKEHIPDLAFQKWICEKAGLIIKRCFVYFLNKEFVKNGEITPHELILKEEVTEKVELETDIENNALVSLQIINNNTVPSITISQSCNNPHECLLKKDCWGTLPKNNVLHLTNWRTYWKLFAEGIQDMKDIPTGTKLSDKDEVIKDSAINNIPFISKEHIKHFLNSLHYPLYHFDFETIDTAVPLFDKSKPYQKIPFQYSLHIEQKDGTTEHREFLHDGSDDPRLKLLEQMKEDLKGTGDIIVFNKSFEIGVMKKLAEDFPEHGDWLQQAIDRIVDLADPFQSFSYYNPSQKGSYSIKKVLPAITGKGYDGLEIGNGADASALYFYSHVKKEIDGKEDIRKNLLKYCCLDTEGMVWIIDELKKLVKNE